MKCYICDETDWVSLSGAHRQAKMQVCKKCGNLCHEVEPVDEAKLKDYYRRNYKPVLGIPSLVTTNNKLQYIGAILGPHLEGKKGLVCGDIGAATGYVLDWLRRQGHRVYGSEWVINNRRLSEHFYSVPLAEDLPDKKYDLLTMYHVLEHLIEPDVKLSKYADMLGPDGRFFISTPKWLGLLEEESGTPIQGKAPRDTAQGSFDELFHKNHINLFTTRSLRNLFNKAGLTVVDENLDAYGQTYVLRRGEKKPIEPEDWQQVLDKVNKQRLALELYFQQKFVEAVKAWPPFPEAWGALIFGLYGKDPERQADMLQKVDPQARGSWRFMVAEAQWLARMERLEEAVNLANAILKKRYMADVLYFVAECLTRMGKYQEANSAFARVAELHPHRWDQCYTWIVSNCTKMPTWDEKAEAQLREVLFQRAKDSGQVKLAAPEPKGQE